MVLVNLVVHVLEAKDLAPTEPDPQLKQELHTLVALQPMQYMVSKQEVV
jgi:hypothetical protein